MVKLSLFNNTYNQLNASSHFLGQLESTADLVSISVNVHCSEACRINIKQYRASDLHTQVQDNAEDVPANTKQVVQTPIKAAFYQVEVINLSAVDMSFTKVTTYLQSTHYVHLDIRKLSQETDNVVMYGVDDIGAKLPIHVDASGNIVTAGGGGGATSDVNIVSQSADLATETTLSALSAKVTACDTTNVTITSSIPYGTNLIGSVLALATNDLNQGIQLKCDLSNNLLVSDTTSQGYLQNLNATNSFIQENTADIVTYTSETSTNTFNINNKITKCDTDNVAISSGSIDVYGRQSNFNFFPTPENNTAQIYADETAGTNVVGGWQYVNSGTGGQKINWYIYAASNPLGNPTNSGQSVASASSVYAVVNQESVTTPAYPYVVIYTRADSGTNAGPFKSRLVFQNTTTATTGMKLLYTGSDPVDIHPEITGANRVNLPFVLAASTKSLAAAAAEEILTCSLQTDSGASAGRYNFVMQQFGVEWVNTPFILPIQNGKVIVDTGSVAVTGAFYPAVQDVSGSVSIHNSLPAGTNVIGKVYTFENSSLVESLGPVTSTGLMIKSTPGSLFNLTCFNTGNAISYLKVYNKATAATAADTPLFTLPILHDSPINTISCHNVLFDAGISIRATADYDPTTNTSPNGNTYVTAFYNGFTP